jgi:hypothetical protein
MTIHAPRLPIAVDPLIAEAKQRARRRRLTVACLLGTVACLGLGLSLPARSGGAERSLGTPIAASASVATVDASGYVGPLRLDHSSVAAIRRFAGKPDFDGVGTFEAVLALDPTMYRALGYACSPTPTPASGGRDPGGVRPAHIYCGTVYYVNPRTHALAGFWTDSPAFRTSAGTRPGMSESTAVRLERFELAFPGNVRNTDAGSLGLETACTKAGSAPSPSCKQGRITALVLESRNHGVGLLFE